MQLKRPRNLMLAVFLLGLLNNLLFWEKPFGINFALFTLACLAGGFVLANWEEARPSGGSLWLLLPIAFFAVMSFVRLEPITSFVNFSLTLGLLGVFAYSFLNGQWLVYNLTDHVKGWAKLGFQTLGGFAPILGQVRAAPSDERDGLRKALAVGRGLALALPVVLVFASLLASADLVFEQGLDRLIEILNLENLAEYISRGVLILVVAYLLAGVYLYALSKSKGDGGTGTTALKPFLGFTEAAVILGSVNLLFAAFVTVQFRYFFGGQANIVAEGFTYSEYARRGFAELNMVAFFSLMLFLGLSAITERGAGRQKRVFSGLGILLILLVGVMLVSAFQRLTLYEGAYGFTRLRTYTHVFIFWLGLLLAAVAALETMERQAWFVGAVLLAGLGFGASLNLLNVDAFIVRQNIARINRVYAFVEEESSLRAIQPVDIPYLASLSEDALPALVRLYVESEGDERAQDVAAGAIACHAIQNRLYRYPYPWQGYHLGRAKATETWAALVSAYGAQPFLAGVDPTRYGLDRFYVMVEGERVYCINTFYWD